VKQKYRIRGGELLNGSKYEYGGAYFKVPNYSTYVFSPLRLRALPLAETS